MSDSLDERRPVPPAARDRTDTAQQGVSLTSELASQAPIAADTASTAPASADGFADTASDAVGVAQAHADVAKAAITAAQEAASPPEPSWIYGMVIGFLGVALLVLVVAMVIASLTTSRAISADVVSAVTLILGGLIGILAPTPSTKKKKQQPPG